MAPNSRLLTPTSSVVHDRRTFLKSLALAAPLGQPRRWTTRRSAVPYPPGYDVDYIDVTRALAQHTRSVTASESVHTTLSYAATANGGATIRDVEAWTDYQRHLQLVDATAVYATGQRYTVDGRVYTKTAVSYADTLSYDRSRGDILVDRSTGTDVLERFLPYLDIELHKTATEDGQHLFTYDAVDLDTSSFTMFLRQVDTIRSNTGSLTVDAQGRIRTFTFDLDAWGDDGNPLTVETVLSLDGFGQTTVRQPDWVQTEFQ